MEICRSVLLCDHGPHHYWYVFISKYSCIMILNIHIPFSNQIEKILYKNFTNIFITRRVHKHDLRKIKFENGIKCLSISNFISSPFYLKKNRSHIELLLSISFEIPLLNSSEWIYLVSSSIDFQVTDIRRRTP